jgi:hypothetical protein
MRIGPLEIVLIIGVAVAVALIARVVRLGRVPTDAARQRRDSHPVIGRAGIALIILGIAVLGIVAGLFRWVLQGYLWALVVIGVGVFMVLQARRKG